jgi:hypothetical protein
VPHLWFCETLCSGLLEVLFSVHLGLQMHLGTLGKDSV